MMDQFKRVKILASFFRDLKVFTLLFIGISLILQSNTILAKPETLPIYDVSSQSSIGEVALASRFVTISEGGRFNKVQFVKPTIKGWVSEDFLVFEPGANGVGFVKVNTDVLNFRVGPSASSRRITKVYRNYTSRVLQKENGFVQIFAPVSLIVMIDAVQNNSTVLHADQEQKLDTEKAGPAENDEENLALTQADDEGSFSIKKSSESVTKNQASTHLISPGDAISLVVFGEADLSLNGVRVPQSGQVSFPLLGAVNVVGRTTAQIEKELEQLLSQGYVLNPRLSVSIFSYRPIFIRGEVLSTGSFPYNEGLTVAKAIALAGGLKPSASEFGISLMRDGEIIAKGLSVNSLQVIASGDIVSVDADARVKEAESAFIYLHGEVASSGEYEFRPGLTVEKAVVLAGGFTLRASKRKIDITRYEGINDGVEPEELRKVKLYTPVKPGDVIKVGASWF